MLRPERSLLILISLVLAAPAAWAVTYVVRSGETLSEIASLKIPGRIWGKKGSLARLISLNPHLAHPDRIQPGQEIELGELVSEFTPTPNRKIAAVESTPDDTQLKNVYISTGTSSLTPPPGVSDSGIQFARHSELALRPQAFFTRLDGVDKTNGAAALVFSDQNYGIGLDWRQMWSESLETFVTLDFRHITMRSVRVGQALQGTSQTNSQMGGGLTWRLGENWELGAGFFMAQELFFDSSSAGIVRIDAVPVIEPEAHARYAWILPRPLGAGFEATARALLPTSTGAYATQLGSAYSGRVYLEQQLKSFGLKAALYYERASYSSVISGQVRSDVGLQFQAAWTIGEMK
jgi:hypothetical protein